MTGEVQYELFDHRYKLLHQIGIGATGVVWLARDTQIPRDVALKLMRQGASVSDIQRERFQREVDSLNELGNSHPNIPQLYGANVSGKMPYLVMEYVGGHSLNDLISSRAILKIPTRQRIHRIVHDIADALTYAHDRNIIHRDIKPDNVKILGNADKTYLLDFGIAVLDVEATRRGIGTPRYIAPELRASQQADIFSFALVVYEIIFGFHPVLKFDEHIPTPVKSAQLMTERISSGEWVKPSKAVQQSQIEDAYNVDWQMVDVVFEQGFRISPDERPRSARALVEGLQEAFKQNSTSEIVLAVLESERKVNSMHDKLGAIMDSSTITIIEEDDENLSVEASQSLKKKETAHPNLTLSWLSNPANITAVVGFIAFVIGVMLGSLIF